MCVTGRCETCIVMCSKVCIEWSWLVHVFVVSLCCARVVVSPSVVVVVVVRVIYLVRCGVWFYLIVWSV